MPKVRFTSALKRFFPDLNDLEIPGSTVAEVMQNLGQAHPALVDYILDEQRQVRQHVNIFVREKLIEDRQKLSDAVEAEDEVYIFQALSGG